MGKAGRPRKVVDVEPVEKPEILEKPEKRPSLALKKCLSSFLSILHLSFPLSFDLLTHRTCSWCPHGRVRVSLCLDQPSLPILSFPSLPFLVFFCADWAPALPTTETKTLSIRRHNFLKSSRSSSSKTP